MLKLKTDNDHFSWKPILCLPFPCLKHVKGKELRLDTPKKDPNPAMM